MIADIIVSWPRSCDYPLWRQMIRDNRVLFENIIIAFTETNTGYDYREFLRDAMGPDRAIFIDPPVPGGIYRDWRDVAVNQCLERSYSNWVWFTEQDFYPRSGFWNEVKGLEDMGCDAIVVYEGSRMHPCCLFVKRELINKTRKMFGIIPDVSDHFSMFQKDVEKLGAKIGVINPNTYFHYNGLSHNWSLITNGKEPNFHYKEGEFIDWLIESMAVKVPTCFEWDKIAHAGIMKWGGAKTNLTTPPDHSPTTPPASI